MVDNAYTTDRIALDDILTVYMANGDKYDSMWAQRTDDGDVYLIDRPYTPMQSLYYVLTDDKLYFDHEMRDAELIGEVESVKLVSHMPAGDGQ